jgi:pimeloyl-ACP methyl ester carboxylesterase
MLRRLLNAVILLPDRYCYQVPADLGLSAEAVAFPNAQGHLLRGFLFQPVGRAGTPSLRQGEAPVVLFCPGTSGNLSSHLYYVELLCRAGCAVLSVDYTGFGQSAGQASLQTLVTDVLCASNFLRREQHIDVFGIFGMSLGANVALIVAAQQQDGIRAVAVEGLALYGEITYGVLTDGIMGPHHVTTMTYEGQPPVPRRHDIVNHWFVHDRLARALAWLGTRVFPYTVHDPLESARLLTNTPVLCIHGVEDSLLPFEGTLQVYDILPGAKHLWLIPEVGHPQEAALAQDNEYVAQLAHFFYATLQGHASCQVPTITAQLMPHGHGKYTLHLRNTGAPGLVLTTIVAEHTLACRTVWVQAAAELPVHAMGRRPLISCRRLFEVVGAGATARPRATPRGQQYRTTWQPIFRELSQALHERRLHALAPLLPMLPRERPEPPFNFFLGIYCVQIMKRTRRTMPHLARAAAQAFLRYWHWHYASAAAPPGQPSLWDLAAGILGQEVNPRRVTPAGR